MITWDIFYIFAILSLLFFVIGSAIPFFNNGNKINTYALSFFSVGEIILGAFIVLLWFSLERPPLRTMGETRLWYSFFMGLAAIITYVKWRYKWIFAFSALMSSVFLMLNIFKPELHDKTLMPALQSVWFVPHVTIYMFSYSLLGCAFILAIILLFKYNSSKAEILDKMVLSGVAALTIGMLTGSLWAKQAWGTYWNWDPKESWALITWLGYLLYIHLRETNKTTKWNMIIVIISFCCLQMCWWGVNYLPSAQDSIHTYSR